ncbi:hypothetical protein PUV54_01275 [Hyphococcus flavus]|uniref:Uncharacterized protein n=1 Tax=Hyphococcus flavus TaxID=1866326 RepID=A0AAE9ZFJ8_9PROT|nr:hypothetical protein [Hyphococcus flavus]WDI31817.1 hypothetical protein PUV54_01275 [Hyphococcus flavus]
MTPDQQKRKAAIRALINIAILEGAVLFAVVAFYVNTQDITHLMGGIIASTLIFGPMFFRWFKAHGDAFKPSKPNTE